jgi:tripartite ATP-independent transporter DctM subunit
MLLSVITSVWLLLVFAGVPIGVAMIFVSMGYFYYSGIGLSFAVQRMVDGLNSFPLLAVPLFILAASILNSGGVTNHLFGFARSLVGHLRGGLGHVNVLASLFFSGMSGSAIADAAGLGKMEIKAMREAGYDDEFSGSVTAASSMIGPLVPPSITMVLYGVVSNTSIGRLFLGGVVPGFLCAASLMAMVYVLAHRRNYPVEQRATARQLISGFVNSFPALMTPFVIIGGIFSGMFSPTEAAAVTVAYAILIDLVFYRQLTWRKLWDAIYETATTSASIAVIIAGVSMLGVILAREQAPQQVAGLFLTLADSPITFLIGVNRGFRRVAGDPVDRRADAGAGGQRLRHRSCPFRHRRGLQPDDQHADAADGRRPSRRRQGRQHPLSPPRAGDPALADSAAGRPRPRHLHPPIVRRTSQPAGLNRLQKKPTGK